MKLKPMVGGSALLLLLSLLLGCVLPRLAGPTPSPSATPSPPTLSPTPPRSRPADDAAAPEFENALLIPSHTWYTAQDNTFRIVGEVLNGTATRMHWVKVKVSYTNRSRELETAERYAYAKVLLPGEKAPFELTLEHPPPDPEDMTLEVHGTETTEMPLAGLELIQHTFLTRDNRPPILIGEVRNAGHSPATQIRVILTAYDRRGNVAGVGLAYTPRTLLKPDEVSPFTMYTHGLPTIPDDYRLSMDAGLASEYALQHQAQVTILSTREYTDQQGHLIVVGEVRNTGPDNAGPIAIPAAFYDRRGRLIAVESGYAWHNTLPPGERSPFKIELYDPPSNVDRSTLWVQAYKSDKTPPGGLLLLDEKRTIDEQGELVVSGRVKNDGDQTLTRVRVALTVYDDHENVTAVEQFFVHEDLLPGTDTPFEIKVPQARGPHQLYVQGRIKDK